MSSLVAGADAIRLVIADDHPIFRDGLRKLLESERDFRVVGEAGDGQLAVQMVRALQPDILLLDLAMPGTSGLETLRHLRQLSPPVRTLVLAAEAERHDIVEAIQLGARGVILKSSSTDLLFKSLRTIMTGQYWVNRDSVADLIEDLRAHGRGRATVPSKSKFGLTPRELEIIAKVADGCANKEIAEQLSISDKTVKHHLTNIFDKLGVYTRLELLLFAMHHGLSPSDRA